MTDVFLKLLNMSIAASWVVLAVIVFRALFRKAPRWISLVMWGTVALRLVIPFSVESPLSMILLVARDIAHRHYRNAKHVRFKQNIRMCQQQSNSLCKRWMRSSDMKKRSPPNMRQTPFLNPNTRRNA